MRTLIVAVAAVALVPTLVAGAGARDRPFDTSLLKAYKFVPPLAEKDLAPLGQTELGGQFSKSQIEKFRCSSSGNPATAVDMSCNTTTYGQNFAPDNEIAVAVDPDDADHVVAGSNDYYYRFNNATGTRQAIVPTGFFTSFDGGAHWIDGQIPIRTGNGAGDPAPAIDGKHHVALMAQLENVGGHGGPFVSQGNVSVSRSTDGGVHWSEPIKVFKGQGAGIGPANQAVFWDKEYIAVNNYPGTPGYGRVVVTATKFVNGLHGSYASSAIWASYSDNGGATWSAPFLISGKNPTFCTFQTTGPDDGSCDEDQWSIPEFGPDGSLYVHFINGQHEAAWEVTEDFDDQIMVVKAAATGGGLRSSSFGAPVHVADTEDGLSDMPFSVIRRQTIWGHQIRWQMPGNIAVDPTDADHVVVVWNDRGTPNPNATEGCFATSTGGLNIGSAPDYDPCDAGPGSDTNIYMSQSFDGGATWSGRTALDATAGHQWYPWADFKSDGTLVAAWDQDTVAAVGMPIPANNRFVHVLWNGGSKSTLSSAPEKVDISVTHWTGQYVPESRWPRVCGPAGYSDPPVTDAAGKDCNVFDGDYTGLAVGPDDSINVVWTGLNRFATSPQTDFYTGEPHDGYAQDAMFARR